MTDEQLVIAARAGDAAATAALFGRYGDVGRRVASRYFLAGGDRDDVDQEALFGLWKAIRDFDHAVGIPFGAFAVLCVRRQVIAAVKTATRLKHAPLTTAVAGDVVHESGDAIDVLELLPALNTDPVELLEGRRRAHLILDVIRRDMSPVEQASVIGRANGDTYLEIERRLVQDEIDRREFHARAQATPIKVVDNAIQRARRKIEAALLEDDRLPLGAAA